MTASGSTQHVGSYQLLAKIGEGGMGVVHLAQEPSGRRVAIKVLRAHVVGDDQGRARMAREVTSLRRVRSPRVAEVYDADPWGDLPYVVTRYVPGLSLHDHVDQNGPILGEDLTMFAKGLAEALVAVHRADVLHRDVKPSNVLVEGRNPVLIDFGLAQLSDDSKLTHTGWLLGTPGYLAPEILYGEDPTPAADVHSWAATVVFAATGRGPYGKGPAVAVMDRVRRGEHDLSGLPDALYWMVQRSLMTDPRDRPSSGQLVEWLDGLVGGAPAPAPALIPDDRTQVVTPPRQPRSSGNGSTATREGGARFAEPADPAPTSASVRPTSSPGQGYYSPTPWPPPVRPPNKLVAGVFWLGLLAVIVAGAVTMPVITAMGVFALGWLIRTVTVRSRALQGWRRQRGIRKGDSLLATVCTPWFSVLALPGAIANTGLAVVDGAIVVVIMTLMLPPSSLVAVLALGGLITGVLVWWGPFSRDVRYGAKRVSSALLQPGLPTFLVMLLVGVIIFGLLTIRQVSGPTYEPLPSPPWEQELRDLVP